MENNIEQKKIEKAQTSPWTYFVRKKVVAGITIIGLLVTGLYSIMTIPKESMPEVKVPIGVIYTVLPGATPSDTEELLTKPIEKEVANLTDIEELNSTSGFGVSVVTVQFNTSVELSDGLNKLQEASDKVSSSLPDNTIGPEVIEIALTDFPIITFSLVSDISTVELNEIARDVKDEIQSVPGVLKININGEIENNIIVTLDHKKLESANLSITDISSAIKYNNLTIPAGTIEIDEINYSIRFEGRIQNTEDIQKIIIKNGILLGDIADVEFKNEKPSTLSRIGDKNDTKNAISLAIYKKTGGNILEVADESNAKIEELKQNGVIPEDVEVVIASDNAKYTRDDLNNLLGSGVQTFILIIVLMFLALGLKEGILSSLSIPISILIAFPILLMLGETLNSLTMFALVISIGMLVDNSIVMMEAFHTNMSRGYSSKDSAMLAIETFKWAIVSSSSTTIFAFLPMLIVSGIIGEFIKTLPITLTVTLIASLFVAITLIPALATRYINEEKFRNKSFKSILDPIIDHIKKRQENRVVKLIESKLNRRLFIAFVSILLIGAVSLPATGFLKTEMFPRVDIDYFIVSIETPKGTAIEETTRLTKKVEDLAKEIPELKNFVSIIGSNQSAGLSGASSGMSSTNSNIANLTVNLVEKENRKRTSYEISDEFRTKIKESITEGKVTVEDLQQGPPSDAPVVINIEGSDIPTLKVIANDVEEIIKNVEGTRNVRNNLEQGLNEFVFKLDKSKLTFHGLVEASVASTIRAIVQGETATEITLNGKDTDIKLKYDIEKPTLTDIENFQIPSPKGYMVTLKDLGKYEFVESLSSIEHREQTRFAQVYSDITNDVTSVEVTTKIQEKLKEYQLPKGYQINYGGDFESITGSFSELGLAMVIAVILIMMNLIIEFNSIRQTIIVLITVPLSLIGVLPGLMIFGLNLSFSAFIGIVALAGIVVNNAIIMIDRINSNRTESKMELKEAIINASQSRVRPILLTTITTVIGAIPVAMADEFWRGIGVTLAVGLSVSTIFTLVMTPMLYYVLEKKHIIHNN